MLYMVLELISTILNEMVKLANFEDIGLGKVKIYFLFTGITFSNYFFNNL